MGSPCVPLAAGCPRRHIAKAQAELDAFEADTTRVDQFLALTKKYTDFSVLTTPMIYEFIDKILVHAPDRSTGDRTQEVDIYLKFIGKFDVPLPEPTAEELAADYLRVRGQDPRPRAGPLHWRSDTRGRHLSEIYRQI